MTASTGYKSLLIALLVCFLVLDLSFSTYHYSRLPTDGDLTRIASPISYYQPVLDDPLGVDIVKSGTTYRGAGRFSAHKTVLIYGHILQALSSFSHDPIQLLYWSNAVVCLLMHLFFLGLIWAYCRQILPLGILETLVLLCLTTLFIQTTTYYISIGIIDRCISYVFFYAWPILLLGLYFFIYFRSYHQHKPFTLTAYVLLTLLAVYLASHGPLVQPIVFMVTLFFFVSALLFKGNWRAFISRKSVWVPLLFFNALCLYAFYLSRFNAENVEEVSLLDRYGLLGKGYVWIVSENTAYMWIGILLSVNLIWLQKVENIILRKWFNKFALFLLIGIASYTLLLPWGGYRCYREFILRYDTLIPVTLMIVLFVVMSTTYLLFTMKNRTWFPGYMLLILCFAFQFTWADIDLEAELTQGEKKSFYAVFNSRDTLIKTPQHSNMGTWQVTDLQDEETLRMLTRLYRRWHIIKPYQQLQ